jgi:hypothetical protein
MQTEIQTRLDADIEDDILVSLRRFGPLIAARRFFKIQSIRGQVTVTGNSGSPQAKHVLRDYIEKIRGVLNIDMSDLHDDETIRLNIGAVVPEGILVNVQFGSVVLISKSQKAAPEILDKVRSIAGIRHVMMA